MRSFRSRLVATLVGLVAATALLLSLGSYLVVDGSLRNRLVSDAVGQAGFLLSVLVPERLSPTPDLAELQASGLEEDVRRRGAELAVVLPDGTTYASRLPFSNPLGLVGPELERLVDSGRVGYEWVEVDGAPFLAVGGRSRDAGVELYLFFPASGVEDALRRLAQTLAAVGLLLVALASVVAGAVAGRVLRPVRQASEAAARVAAGDLDTRVPVESDDEFATWAAAFNRMAESLQREVAGLQESEARHRRFVSDVSHELRTPLTGLVNEASMLSRHLEVLPPEAREVGSLLVHDVARLRRLVEDLLEMSRLDAGSEELVLSEVDLHRFLGAVVDARLPAATLRIPAGRTVVRSDRRRLERILANLLDNARLHAGGEEVEVAAGVSGGVLTVEVADRGPGIPDEDPDRLFERFHKHDPSRTSQGTGLGLSIAREHARAMGGGLEAGRRPGGGAVFRMRVPVTVLFPERDPGVTGQVEHEDRQQRP